MCERPVENEPETLEYIPDCFKIEGICKETFCRESYALGHISDHFKTQEMCEKAVEEDP